jgi:uncharacterized protein YdaU (DUF1376 family)
MQPAFWPSDFLGNTAHLNAIELGAYLLLIQHYWLADGLVDDDRQFAAITGLPVLAWRQIRPTVAGFFDEGWRHRQLDEHIDKTRRLVASRKLAGSIGGTARAIGAGQKLAGGQA